MLLTLIAFVVALAVLIAGHEWGHYRMAVACGVKVLRFSIGFGPVLLRWKPKRQHPGQDTEFALSAIPLGGYVKMLDEREAPVAEEERDRAYNTQPLVARALIAVAGPGANLAMAVLFFAAVAWLGTQEPRAILAAPPTHTLAYQAGIQAGDQVRAAALAGDPLAPVESFDSLRLLLAQGVLERRAVILEVAGDGVAGATRKLELPLAQLPTRNPDEASFRQIGITAPLVRPLISRVMTGGAAERAGLRAGDVVVRVGDAPVADGEQLRELIRADTGTQNAAQPWLIDRDGKLMDLTVWPDVVDTDGARIGRIGAYIGQAPEMVLVRRGVFSGFWSGVSKTWEMSALTLRVLGRMVLGQVSVKNLSGPVAIAEYAGQSARMGFTYYLSFLALISVSLGVLNLLPIPVLDGGHLMYFAWEAVTGKPVSIAWLERLQALGITLLLLFMMIAIYNDLLGLWARGGG